MKRRVVLILLLLVAGAIVNVAVAWGLALGMDSTDAPVRTTSSSEFAAIQVSRCIGARKTETQRGNGTATIAEDRGWPLLGLSCSHDPPVFARFTSEPAHVRWGIPTGLHWKHAYPVPRALPLLPIWPGFAINTVFYAVVLWLLFAAPFALRRRRRIKRGLCPKCAYPVGTNQVCTECGAAVPSKPSSMVASRNSESR